MLKTRKYENIFENRITLNTEELQEKLGCGRKTAVDIGIQSEAKITIGRRVLWNVSKVQKYLNEISQ